MPKLCYTRVRGMTLGGSDMVLAPPAPYYRLMPKRREATILAALSLIGWYTKRRGERRDAARHAELIAAASGRQPE